MLCIILLSLPGCLANKGSDHENYDETIREGRLAANASLAENNASSISVAFFAQGREVWAETFGLADKDAHKSPGLETMYSIASVSKMLATIATMVLVDENRIVLDMPVTEYLPEFEMISPEYRDVTIRMLLNHSSGFPGTDSRNAITTSPYLHLGEQVVGSLKNERLKHDPGFMQTYCNDGFSLLEQIIAHVSGIDYVDFVRENILEPLGMDHSLYPLSAFDDDAYAHTYTGDTLNPQYFTNIYASGGLSSTPSDMLKIAMMFADKGKLGSMRILSQEAVREMGIDQTVGTFTPVDYEGYRYGLGWDTIRQPGLGAVGVTAWAKTGDAANYGAILVVVPEKEMGVVVTGANYGSGMATAVAEKILLRALVEEGSIESFPDPLPETPKTREVPTLEELDEIQGYFAKSTVLLKIATNADDSLNISSYSQGHWTTRHDNLYMRNDGHFSSDDEPLREFYTVTAESRTYLVYRDVFGNKHYQDQFVYTEKVDVQAPLNDAWRNRLDKKWLAVNMNPDSLYYTGENIFRIHEIQGVEGYIFASPNSGQYCILDPTQTDTRGSMVLVLPQNGRDQNDLFILDNNGEEWLRFGSFIYRPLETIVQISPLVVIGSEGYAEWRYMASEDIQKTIEITSNAAWKIYNSEFEIIEQGTGNVQKTLAATSGRYYFLFFGNAGDTIQTTILNE
jgi:CubicO group peptidase (beta-lactamase class C family)